MRPMTVVKVEGLSFQILQNNVNYIHNSGKKSQTVDMLFSCKA